MFEKKFKCEPEWLVVEKCRVYPIIFALMVLVVLAPAIAFDAEHHIAQDATRGGLGLGCLFAESARSVIPLVF